MLDFLTYGKTLHIMATWPVTFMAGGSEIITVTPFTLKSALLWKKNYYSPADLAWGLEHSC